MNRSFCVILNLRVEESVINGWNPLSSPITVSLLRRAYGGQIGTMNFLWKVPSEVKDRNDTKEMQLILNLTKSLPDFHSRQMEKDFINR